MTDLPVAVTARNVDGVVTSAGTTLQVSGGETIVCNRNATPATFAAQVSAAVAGETICLATGNYGDWAGTNKAITIAPQSGANPVIGLNLTTGDANFTIDGGHTEIQTSTNGMVRASSFTSPGISISGVQFRGTPGPSNVTIKRCWFGPSNSFLGGYIEIDGPTGQGNVIDRCWFNQLNDPGEAAIRVFGRIGLMVKNCYFSNMNCDGVKLNSDAAITVQDCEFHSIHPHGTDVHSDCVQFNGGLNCILRRNYFHDFEQALAAFDGTSGNTLTDNVIQKGVTPAAHFLSMYADSPGSIVEHNTIVGLDAWNHPGAYLCTRKSGDAVGKTSFRNNVGPVSIDSGNCSPTANDHNMWAGATSPNINGAPIFVGGASPTTWAGFKLASNSPGRNAGSDGLDVGIRAA